jgi:transposase
MIPIPTGVRVWLATGHTDMRKGFASLSLQVQEVLRRDPLNGHLFCFRGRRGDLLKVIWHDGQGACLYSKPTNHAEHIFIILGPQSPIRLNALRRNFRSGLSSHGRAAQSVRGGS